MSDPSSSHPLDQDKTFAELRELRFFEHTPKDFWPRYLVSLGRVCSASRVTLLIKPAESGSDWRKLTEWTAEGGSPRHSAAFVARLESIAKHCEAEGQSACPLGVSDGRNALPFIVASPIQLLRAEEQCIAVCLLLDTTEAGARESLCRLNLVADVPKSYQQNLVARQAKDDVEKMAGSMDVLISVNAERKFLAAALAFCNELATRHKCDRVSLGWLERGYVRLRTISRTEKFERQMEAAQALEVAMEEAMDQDDEILYPAPEGSTVVNREHEAFAKKQSVAHLISLPLRCEEKAVAVLTCERQSKAFTLIEVQQLRLGCDLAARRLTDLKNYDRWFGARWASAIKEHSAKIVGTEHTWAKLLTIFVAALLAVLFFVKVPYRVEGNFVLRSDEVAYLTTPYDGFIDEVSVRPGITVVKGDSLVRLKTSELELEESAALADWNRYQREAEKARAANSLAEMRIAESMAEQAKARLDLAQYRIDQASLQAPFDGVIVEGDLRDRLGAPVKQAEVLMKVARIETLYVEAEVNERDIHELLGKSQGEMAFVSQPKLKFPIHIETVEQAAFPKEEQNLFLIRCTIDGGPQPWWRPGMSGLCKFDIENRTLIWIVTHRTVDFLRMLLWW